MVSRFSQACRKSVLAIFCETKSREKTILATGEKGVTEMRNFRIGLMVILGVLAAATAWADKGDRNDRGDRPALEDNRHRDHKDDKGDNDRNDSAPVPQTGQVLCYNAAGTQIDCAGSGQDGALQKGVELPTPRFTDKGNGTIKDNLTGLIWLQNANCIRTKNPTFDNDGVVDGAVTWQHALDFLAGINAGTYDCGDTSGKRGTHRTDWRLPNIRELHSLLDFAFSGPAISNAAGTGRGTSNDPFTNFTLDQINFWSSTSIAENPDAAWFVLFFNGFAVNGHKGSFLNVLPVRGGS
jgi:Protein of unknown function (DUF1566)